MENKLKRYVSWILIFLSQTIILLLNDKTIKIWSNFFEVLQTIINGQKGFISFVNNK